MPIHLAVRVFSPDPPTYLFSIDAWEAKDRLRRNEAREMSTGKKNRGIQIVARTKSIAHTLQAQLSRLSEVQLSIAAEHPELYVTNDGLATLEQVAGLPVVGQPIKLFYGPRQKAA